MSLTAVLLVVLIVVVVYLALSLRRLQLVLFNLAQPILKPRRREQAIQQEITPSQYWD